MKQNFYRQHVPEMTLETRASGTPDLFFSCLHFVNVVSRTSVPISMCFSRDTLLVSGLAHHAWVEAVCMLGKVTADPETSSLPAFLILCDDLKTPMLWHTTLECWLHLLHTLLDSSGCKSEDEPESQKVCLIIYSDVCLNLPYFSLLLLVGHEVVYVNIFNVLDRDRGREKQKGEEKRRGREGGKKNGTDWYTQKGNLTPANLSKSQLPCLNLKDTDMNFISLSLALKPGIPMLQFISSKFYNYFYVAHEMID